MKSFPRRTSVQMALVSISSTSMTKEIQHGETVYDGQEFCIFDTPGFFDTSLSAATIETRLAPIAYRSVNGLDAFLYVFPCSRFSMETIQAFEAIKNMFGSTVNTAPKSLPPYSDTSRVYKE